MRIGNKRHELKKDLGEKRKLCELKVHQNAKSTNKERTAFSTNVAGELDFHCKIFNWGPFLTPAQRLIQHESST